TSNLRHESGRFFSIEGVEIKTNWGDVAHWQQPIIRQPEIGILGIITKKFDGVLHFLMQAKIEPGNINSVQLSPTLQATKSNYTRVHKGKSPRYFEYFTDNKPGVRVLLDQLQSEQGARFLKKRNRNIIVEVEEDIEVFEEFCWLTLGQLKHLLDYENIVNMDTRTVISGIPLGNHVEDPVSIEAALSIVKTKGSAYGYGLLQSATDARRGLHAIEDIISWITRLKSKYELDIRPVPLNSLDQWHIDDHSIFHDKKKYFSVIPVRAEIGNREVQSWTQPMIKSAQEGIIAFIIKKINGVYHFLVQAKLEAGNFDIIELAPTVQCLTGNYRKGLSEYEPEFLNYVLQAGQNPARVRYSAMQSEEGGRFFREQNRNMIVEAPADFDENLPENFIWMTLNQLQLFIKFNNYLNIQARSLISAVRFL
ncbi:MAG: NDP-hexose 2,3-dehydratase family protein, partial [Gammaproteobacteria bacterium]|nr:NDP-hexose 2,3-dehydratase family protein [Gammaproteobacteria bacterium]